MKNIAKTLAATIVLAAALSAQTGVTVKTIINNGPLANRYDMVILGDGYTKTQQTRFDADCKKFTAALFLKEPYKTFRQFFNIHTVFRASQQSGANHPDKSPPIVVNNAYGASYNTGGTARCLYIKNSSQALKDAAQAPATEGRVLVLVNDSRYGGCAGTFAVSYNGSSMNEVQIHEVGHSFGLLADEYDYPYNTYTGGEPGQVNVTKDKTGAKWKHWRGVRSVSAYEGARYYKKGIFRPAPNCLMRSLGRGLCPVCEEQIVKRAYVTVSSIDATVPSTTNVTLKNNEKKTFSFKSISPTPASTVITWSLGGTTIQTGGTSLIFDASKYTAGTRTLTVSAQDKSKFVRNDPTSLLKNAHSWRLNIQGLPIPDLQMGWLSPNKTSVQPLDKIEITTVTNNKGYVSAANVVVDYVLSKDQSISSDDQSLGTFAVSLIKANDLYFKVHKGIEIPPHVIPGTYYLGAIADRKNTIKELNETNNAATFVKITVAKGSCFARLSYRDPAVYPVYSANGSGITGGQVLPTVSAPCDAGKGYLILWSFSGTTPGIPVGPSITVPLNWDAWTSVMYPAINGPNLLAFRGTLDVYGQGRATLKFIAKSYSGTGLTGHMAAVLWDKKTGWFTKATNPVEILVNK